MSTTSAQDAKPLEDYIHLERISDRCWRASGRSAFLVWMMMPENCCTCFLDEEGHAVAEISTSDTSLLSNRLNRVGPQSSDHLTFAVFIDMSILESAFYSWERRLSSSAPKPIPKPIR